MHTLTPFERVQAGIEACVAHGVDVINVSLGPASTRFDPDDPLQRATRSAHDAGIPVVVAAGNFGPGRIQALAQAPWVVGVGAVARDGRLLPSSGTGDRPSGSGGSVAREGPGAREVPDLAPAERAPHAPPLDGGRPGPVVVALGTPGQIHDPRPDWPAFEPGTSFAAPRIASIAGWLRSAFRLVIGNLGDEQAGRWSPLSAPVPVPTLGLVDSGVDPGNLQPLTALTRHDRFQLTRSDRERAWYHRMVGVLQEKGLRCSVSHGPGPVRRALEGMARPVPDSSPWEVGAGVVSQEGAEDFLAHLTPSRWLQVFCPEAREALGPAGLRELDQELGPLWPANQVAALRLHFLDGIRLFVAKVV